jgi:putative redox protein
MQPPRFRAIHNPGLRVRDSVRYRGEGSMTIHVRQTGESVSTAGIRNHSITIDRPADKGGTDAGPMGGELFLAAIGGCFMSNLLAAIKARDVEVSDVQTEVIANTASAPPRFTDIELRVSGKYTDAEVFEKLVEIADRGCIMMNTLRDKLDVKLRIEKYAYGR